MKTLPLVAAPLLALMSSLVAPALESDQRAQLDVIAAHQSRWYWFTLLLVAGSLLLIPAYLRLAALVRERSPRLGAVGGALAIGGAAVAVGDSMSQLITWKMAAPGFDRVQMAQLLDRVENAPGATVIFALGGLAVLAGTVILTVGLLRVAGVPRWAAIGISVAILVNIVAFSAAAGAGVAASWALLLASMGAVAFSSGARPAPSRSSG
jgi:hypothetical protein